MNHRACTRSASTPIGRRAAAVLLGLLGGALAVTATPSPVEATLSAAPTGVTASRTTTWKTATAGATTALGKTRTNLARGQYLRAAHHLRMVTAQARTANTAAASLIGEPPTDPESDDVPGVAAVIGVHGLDHRITMELVALLASPRGHHVVPALGRALTRVDECRAAMVHQVISQSAAALDDYVDGLSDVVGVYSLELGAMAAQLAGTGLTPAGRHAVSHAQEVVTATDSEMQRVFGGGERTPTLHR